MAKHIVFLVHGMGNFEPGWSHDIVKRFKAQCNDYQSLKASRAIEMFEFKEVNYNSTFESWRTQWRTDAAAAAKAIVASGLKGGAANDLAKLAAAPADDGFWRTHALDVMMFRYSLQVAEEVGRVFETQILSALRTSPGDLPGYSIVAHSLGTSVIYESLHRMLTSPTGLPSAFRPVNMFMISNTARLLWNRGGSCFSDVMAPDISDDIGSCTRLMDVSHALDPVCAVEPFNPPPADWFGPTAPPPSTYRHVGIDAGDVQSPNVHALEHYLGHPEVHLAMMDWLTQGAFPATDDERKNALARWRGSALMASTQGGKKAAAVEQLKALAPKKTVSASGLLKLLMAFREFAADVAPHVDGES